MAICPTYGCGNFECLHCRFNYATTQQLNVVTFKDMEQLLIEQIAREHL